MNGRGDGGRGSKPPSSGADEVFRFPDRRCIYLYIYIYIYLCVRVSLYSYRSILYPPAVFKKCIIDSAIVVWVQVTITGEGSKRAGVYESPPGSNEPK